MSSVTHSPGFLADRVAGPLVATVVVVVIASLSGGPGSSANPGLVLVGAVIFALVPALIRKLVEIRSRSPVATFAVRVVTGEEGSMQAGDPTLVLERTAELVRQVVGAASVTLISEVRTVRAGASSGALARVPVSFRGEQIGWIEASFGEDDQASSDSVTSLVPWVGLILDSVFAVTTLRREIAEAEAELRRLQEDRRRVVRTEAARRREIAEAIISGLRPHFDRTQAAIEAGDLNEAAHQAEVLIERLRSVSTSLQGA